MALETSIGQISRSSGEHGYINLPSSDCGIRSSIRILRHAPSQKSLTAYLRVVVHRERACERRVTCGLNTVGVVVGGHPGDAPSLFLVLSLFSL